MDSTVLKFSNTYRERFTERRSIPPAPMDACMGTEYLVPFFRKEQQLWDPLTSFKKTVNMYFCKFLKAIIALSKESSISDINKDLLLTI